MPNPMMEEEDLVRFLSTMVDEEEQKQEVEEHLSLMELEGQEQALGVPETRMMQKTQQEQEEVFKSIGWSCWQKPLLPILPRKWFVR